jgi:hypothetical protein
LNLVGADGGQVGEQAGEAVHRMVVFGAFARCLGEGFIGALGGGERLARLAAAAGLSLSWNRIGARACLMCQLM